MSGTVAAVDGTCSESRVETFTGAGTGHSHESEFRYTADHPGARR